MSAVGDVFAWGRARNGVLGTGDVQVEMHTPVQVLRAPLRDNLFLGEAPRGWEVGSVNKRAGNGSLAPGDVRCLSLSDNHCVALDAWSAVYTWGKAGAGRLGRASARSSEAGAAQVEARRMLPLDDQQRARLLAHHARQQLQWAAAVDGGGGGGGRGGGLGDERQRTKAQQLASRMSRDEVRRRGGVGTQLSAAAALVAATKAGVGADAGGAGGGGGGGGAAGGGGGGRRGRRRGGARGRGRVAVVGGGWGRR